MKRRRFAPPRVQLWLKVLVRGGKRTGSPVRDLRLVVVLYFLLHRNVCVTGVQLSVEIFYRSQWKVHRKTRRTTLW